MRIGRHMPRPTEALACARQIGCDTTQVFLTNARGWQTPALDLTAAEAFRAAAHTYEQLPVVVHAAYIINLASPRDDLFAKSVTLLRATMARAALFGAASVVVHIGSHTGAGEEAGLARLAEGLRRVLDGPEDHVRLLLENDTGGGGKLGVRFANLALLLDRLAAPAARLGVCLDTAHLWGAGYDLGTAEGATATLTEAEDVLGLARVQVVHLNDARAACGSHRDLHARLGEGAIALEGLAAFLRAPGLAHAAILLETPYFEDAPGHIDWHAEARQLELTRRLAASAVPSSPVVTARASTIAGA